MFNDVPTIDFDTEDKPDIPVYNPEMNTAAAAPKISLNPGYNPFKSSSSTGAVPMGAGFSVPKSKPQVDEKWEQLYEGLKDQDDVQGMEQTMVFSDDSSQDNTPDSIIAEKSPAHYQYKGKYIMTAVKSGKS